MSGTETVHPITLWYSTLGTGDGHDFATRGYLRSLMSVDFFGLRIPPSISTSLLLMDEKADPEITQFASLTRPPEIVRMKPLKVIEPGDPRIGTTKVIDGTDEFGNPIKVEALITEGSVDLDVKQDTTVYSRQEVRSVVIHHDPASLARHFTTLTKQGRPSKVGYVGVTVWETSHIPEAVAMILNELNAIVVPSKHTKGALEHSGVDIPIEVVPHTFDPERWPSPTTEELNMKERIRREKYVFYAIATPIERKNLFGLIKAYFKAFENRQDVILKIKTSGTKYELGEVAKKALEAAKLTGRRPPIKIFTGKWPVDKIRAFHLDGDCYVSACRAEGFGLCEMEAKLCGSRVITSEWGAAKEFLEYKEIKLIDEKNGHPYRSTAMRLEESTTGNDILVPCKLIPVEGMYGIGCYESDQMWADPNEDALIASMIRVASEGLGPDLSSWSRLRMDLGVEDIGNRLASVILQAREDAEKEAARDVF